MRKIDGASSDMHEARVYHLQDGELQAKNDHAVYLILINPNYCSECGRMRKAGTCPHAHNRKEAQTK